MAEEVSCSSLAERFESSFRVGSIPEVFLVPDYISEDEEAALLSSARASTARWTVLSNRRLQTLGAPLSVSSLARLWWSFAREPTFHRRRQPVARHRPLALQSLTC